MLPVDAVASYAQELRAQLTTGHAAEHAYRPALKQLIERLGDVRAVNDPKRSEHGAPDFVFVDKRSATMIRGWAEAKDVDANLDKTEKTEQLQRYAGYPSLFLTNYVEFRFYKNGSKYETIEIGELKNGTLEIDADRFEALADGIVGFLTQPPESITSGVRLAEVMGAKARRIRHNVERFLTVDDERNEELLRIYELIKTQLVHDLDEVRFADMYAQTLVYGLFAARYNDTTPESFSRAEARDLVPPSNPFLREFFDHIAGANFDSRLAHIVDELCKVFAISSVHEIIHEHLAVAGSEVDDKDPIIHFYEDFLEAYDPVQRKKMGAYYTPLPVVRFMVRTVDDILKRDFDLAMGLADTSKVSKTVTKQEKVETEFHKVQILDPATGTATFLNEVAKFVHAGFAGQEGRWPSYAKEDLIPRLHGFELMMAPYTVAHLKLGLTLKESGVDDFGRRLGIYLTNSLEEGINVPQGLFQLGLTEAVAQEALQAGEIKTERPVMVMIGNPPYSGESSNKTEFAKELVAGYKFEPGGAVKLRERNSKWLNDDYVKFIAFAESMVRKNGFGVLAMITNNGYLDNPTFRGMRWRLTQTFDQIYVLNLHGNSKKKEVAPGGGKDENVFDIQQGVAIVFGVVSGKQDRDRQADVFHADAWGTRSEKFALLNGEVEWKPLVLDETSYLFTPRDKSGWDEYERGVRVDRLFTVSSVGVVTAADRVLIGEDASDLERQLREAQQAPGTAKVYDRLRDHAIDMGSVQAISYRPFDERAIYYDDDVLERSRLDVMKHFVHAGNVGLAWIRPMSSSYDFDVFVTPGIYDQCYAGNKSAGAGITYSAPLYLHHDDGSCSPNFDPGELARLTANLDLQPSPEDVLDYVYGLLRSRAYRARYKEFLETDYPRVAVPSDSAEFKRFASFGKELRELHLMSPAAGVSLITTYPVAGTNEVEAPRFADGKVWINSQQYFGGVPEIAWDFVIGGYQPAQKWLKDRKGKVLESNAIEHYQKIIAVLSRTDQIMRQIDA